MKTLHFVILGLLLSSQAIDAEAANVRPYLKRDNVSIHVTGVSYPDDLVQKQLKSGMRTKVIVQSWIES